MKNELIPVFEGQLNQQSVLLVDARLLHQKLESLQQFSNWVQNRIEEYGFTQDIDFIVINKFIKDKTAFGGKRKIIDYHLTIDTAKELAMVERNEKGREARKYFIEMERIAREAINAKNARAKMIETYRAEFLLQAPSEWEKLFPDEYYEALMHLHGNTFNRSKMTPSYCAQITLKQVYKRVVPDELLPSLRSSETKKIHQWFNNGGRGILTAQIQTITALAKTSFSRVDFEHRCDVAFGKGVMVQLAIPFFASESTAIN